MKKFFMYCLIIVVALFVGFTTYYFIATDEDFKLAVAESESIKLNVGDRFEIDKVISYNKNNAKDNVEVLISNEKVISYDKTTGVFVATAAGTSNITLKPSHKKFGPYTLIVKVGDGKSSDSPIYVSTANQLNSIGQAGSNWTLSMNYELTADIYLSGVQFVPIGNGSDSGFIGTFNGANHTIYNMTISPTTLSFEYAGLFAKIGVGGTVKNVKVSEANIAGSFSAAGVIAGVNNGTIVLCEVSTSVITNNHSTSHTGGLVGRNQYKITNTATNSGVRANIALCQVIDIKLITQSLYTGGLAGENFASNIQNSCAVVQQLSVRSGTYFGGLIGENSSLRNQINNTVVYRNASVQYCHAIINGASLSSPYSGGFVGMLRDNNSDNTTKNNNTFTRNYFACNGVGAIGSTSGTAQRDISADKISGKAITDMKVKATYVNWDFANYWELSSNYATINFGATFSGGSSGDVDDDSDIDYGGGDNVPNEDGLLGVLDEMRANPSSDKAYTITTSMILDLKGANWVPIGTASRPFCGQLLAQDGAELIVKNFKITDYQYAGFFGYVGTGAVIKGLNLQNVQINNEYAAVSSSATGAICGYVETGARILSCTASGINISATNAIGGAVGINHGTLQKIEVREKFGSAPSGIVIDNTIAATSASSEIGGIVGKNSGTVDASIVSGITLKINNNNQAYAGGVAGGNYGTVKNSGAKKVSIEEKAATMVYAGGIVGFNNKDVSKSYSHGGSITLSTITSTSRAAGVAAYNAASGQLKNSSWSLGSIMAYAAAGVCGDNYGKINECSAGSEELGIGSVKGVHVAGLVHTNHQNAVCQNNLTICIVGSTSNDGSASGVAHLMKENSIISQTACGVQFNSVNSRENNFAESSCRFKSFALNSFINVNNWFGERYGIMEKCVIVDRGAHVQSGEYLLDEIGIIQNKYAMIFKAEEAMGSKNYTCYIENGFSETVWNFNYALAHFPTLKNAPNFSI